MVSGQGGRRLITVLLLLIGGLIGSLSGVAVAGSDGQTPSGSQTTSVEPLPPIDWRELERQVKQWPIWSSVGLRLTAYQIVDKGIALEEQRQTEAAKEQQYQQIRQTLVEVIARIDERYEFGDLSALLNRLLQEQERYLSPLDGSEKRIAEIEQAILSSRRQSVELKDQLRALPQSVAVSTDLDAIHELVLRRSLMQQRLEGERRYQLQLQRSSTALKAAVEQVNLLVEVIREVLLWFPSHAPLSSMGWEEVSIASERLLQPEAVADLRRVAQRLTHIPISNLVLWVALPLLLALILGWWIPRRLRQLAAECSQPSLCPPRRTLKAIGWTLLQVLPLPLLLYSVSLYYAGLYEKSGIQILAVVLMGSGVGILIEMIALAAVWIMTAHMLLLLTVPYGVGLHHFGWSTELSQRLHRSLKWLLPLLVVMLLLLGLVFGHTDMLVRDLYGRLMLILIVISLAGATGGIFASEAARQWNRHLGLTRLALALFTLLLLGLVWNGYLLTLTIILNRIIYSLSLVVVTVLIHGLMRQILTQRQAELAQQRSDQRVIGEANAAPNLNLSQQALSLTTIDTQIAALLRLGTLALLLFFLYFVWNNLLPTLNWYGQMVVWSRQVVMDGVTINGDVILQDLLLAIFLVWFFTFAVRNIPALVEMVLARAQIDAMNRYTVTTLLRYLLTVIAVVSIFSLLGLHWSELQWMVAALTLGLGFGLQEIVANFVSGIILLFERPIRIGDTVTIGSYNGKVSRIHTRATTVVDWDNREVVIPNKSLITGSLINWTLTDTITRLTVPVSVNHDADVGTVITALKEVADSHRCVMRTPAPSVLFLGLGEGQLNFELRVFVAQTGERLGTLSDLHGLVIERFKAYDLTIATPQMEIEWKA